MYIHPKPMVSKLGAESSVTPHYTGIFPTYQIKQPLQNSANE
jgi:hypothetical protein